MQRHRERTPPPEAGLCRSGAVAVAKVAPRSMAPSGTNFRFLAASTVHRRDQEMAHKSNPAARPPPQYPEPCPRFTARLLTIVPRAEDAIFLNPVLTPAPEHECDQKGSRYRDIGQELVRPSHQSGHRHREERHGNQDIQPIVAIADRPAKTSPYAAGAVLRHHRLSLTGKRAAAQLHAPPSTMAECR
jgi:hypothetical protein